MSSSPNASYMRKKDGKMVNIKTKSGALLFEKVPRSALLRFSRASHSALPKLSSLQYKGEVLVMAVDGKVDFLPKVVKPIVQWMIDNVDHKEVKPLSFDKENSTFDTLVEMASFCDALGLRPASVRRELHEAAIDTLKADLRDNKLGEHTIKTLVKVLPAENWIVSQAIRILTRRFLDGDATDTEAKITDEAYKTDAAIKDLFDAEELLEKQKRGRRRVSAEKAKQRAEDKKAGTPEKMED